ncbi:MAG: DUF2244 domain-containing protein [Nitrosomonadales bacterium]
MIEKNINKKNNSGKIVIRPNPAMPWKTIKKVYFYFGIYILLIAIFLTYINLYLAVPFYGVEFVLFGYALYISAYKSTFFEEIIFKDRNIIIRYVNRKNIKEYSLVREWTNFQYKQPTRTQPSELYFMYKGIKILIGQRVTDQEREILKNLLKKF